MKKISGLLLLAFVVSGIQAQGLADKKNVEKLCGCFDVEFKYAETFSPDPDYKYHERDEISAGTELAFPVELSDKKIVIQHLLIITDSMIIKHWNEEWTYENPVLWKYEGDNIWRKTPVQPEDVKGHWTQTVWEVSDAPRYQGAAEWLTTDGKTVWQNTTDAPLPRREYSVRSDYNILRRTNRIAVTNKGYVHEQDNQKIIRKDGTDKLLVEEKGYNTYVRLDDAKCAAGKAYWEKTKAYWLSVTTAWQEYMNTHDTVELQARIDGKVLHEYLFDLAKQYAAGTLKPAEANLQIRSLLTKFTSGKKEVAAK